MRPHSWLDIMYVVSSCRYYVCSSFEITNIYIAYKCQTDRTRTTKSHTITLKLNLVVVKPVDGTSSVFRTVLADHSKFLLVSHFVYKIPRHVSVVV